MKKEEKNLWTRWYMIVFYVFIGLMFLVLISTEPDGSSKSTKNMWGFTEAEMEASLFGKDTKITTPVPTSTLDFSQVAIQSLYNNGFCYEGMELDGLACGEVEYPYIRIFNSEDYLESGKMLLITTVTKDLYNKFPELYNKEIVYIFRDKNQKTIDRIYVKENKFDR